MEVEVLATRQEALLSRFRSLAATREASHCQSRHT